MRRPLSWAFIWTILGSVAGVIGAAAAVYPLLTQEQHRAYITYKGEIDLFAIETLSEPIALTGNWYVKKGSWWSKALHQTGYEVEKDKRVLANARYSFSLDRWTIKEKVFNGADAACNEKGGAHCIWLVPCSIAEGEFEFGLEYRSKHGLAWARTKLPYCVRRGGSTQPSQSADQTVQTPREDPTDKYWNGSLSELVWPKASKKVLLPEQ